MSVRDLVEFVWRTGDLGSRGHFAGPNRALEGTRTHQRIQKSRPAHYNAEVSVSRTIDCGDFEIELKGRIDGVMLEGASAVIEEIKSVSRVDGVEADSLHWGQARIYGFLYCNANQLAVAELRLTYVELETLTAVQFEQHATCEELRAYFEQTLFEYSDWLRQHQAWIARRNLSIAALGFPFAYRAGQRSMAVAVYKTIKRRGRLFVEAPTGIGKTLSVLFPSIKALGEERIEKIFYLTAKTVGRTVAEETLLGLRKAGLRLRAVSITARDKICFNNGQPCDVRACPFAIGYYDRIKAALKDSLECDVFTRTEIEALARKHQVCPFELSLDLSVWADCVICDYNYVVDPFVSLKRYFSGERSDFAILVDEAHNLVDRAREMFSAELVKEEVLALKAELSDSLPRCAKILGRINSRFLALKKEEGWELRGNQSVRKDLPEKLVTVVREFCKEAEAWLVQNEPAGFRQLLLDFYFRALAFGRTAEIYDEHYTTTFDANAGLLRLFCVDPSALLRNVFENLGATIFFSATLRPIEYYRESLGGEAGDDALQLESPFSADALRVLLHHRVPTRLRDRDRGYDEITTAIGAMAESRRGNYLIYFPSYDYLREILGRFRARFPEMRAEAQASGMSEEARGEFLHKFQAGGEPFVGFAVLGGIFGEGIDLVGERLVGVAIVGVGLPQLCLERDLIREYWQEKGKNGFDYAYTYPGMNRVLQAAGRVIRSETDRGVVLLLDERFARHPYPAMFPGWWQPQWLKSADQVGDLAANFWKQ